MEKEHSYSLDLEWIGNLGEGTRNYTSYSRDYTVEILGKPTIYGSSDPAFRGNSTLYNPEDLFLASISSCHMLWYLHFCSVNNISVVEYKDNTIGTMIEKNNGSGQFTSVTLQPIISIKESDKITLAMELHQKANQYCFIANSLNFKVNHSPKIIVVK